MYIKWSAVHLVVVVVYPFSDPNHSLLHSFWLFFSFPIYFYKNICTDGGGGGEVSGSIFRIDFISKYGTRK